MLAYGFALVSLFGHFDKKINDRSLADTEITVQGNLYLVDNSISGCH